MTTQGSASIECYFLLFCHFLHGQRHKHYHPRLCDFILNGKGVAVEPYACKFLHAGCSCLFEVYNLVLFLGNRINANEKWCRFVIA